MLRIALLALVLVLAPGCCGPQVESRDALLLEVRGTVEKIGTKLKAYQAADPACDPDVRDADAGLIDETLAEIDRVASPPAPAEDGGAP